MSETERAARALRYADRARKEDKESRQANISETPASGSPVLVRLDEVVPEQVKWLWPGRIALGKLTLLAGDPGLGKSFLTMDISARVSCGRAWPDAPHVPTAAGGVILLNAEDGLGDTVVPRLQAAGAELKRIEAMSGVNSRGNDGAPTTRGFDLSRDIRAIEAAVRGMPDCRLVVIDPITAFLGGVDSHKNAEIRGLLAPLSDLASRWEVAIVAVTHLNKSGVGPAIYRAMGSLAFSAAARAAWAVTKDKSDEQRRLFIPIKNNLAPNDGGLAYRIVPISSGGAGVEWEPDPVTVTADDALAMGSPAGDGHSEQTEAAAFLSDLLAPGPRSVGDVKAAAGDAGFSWGTIRRAKKELKLETSKGRSEDAEWCWTLPAGQTEYAPF